MKLSEKFLSNLKAIIDLAFKEKNFWVGKTVQEITIDTLKERGIEPDDFQGAVILTVEEAKVIASFFGAVDACCDLRMSKTEQKTWCKLNKRIKQAEK